MNENEDKILERIKKLLDLANPDNKGSEGEIQTAFAMAQKLLKKHHLSMSQVMSLDEENSSATGFFELKETEVVRYAANILPKWMETIIRAVNSITETKTLIKRSPRAGSSYGNLSIVFVGEVLDVNSSTELFNFLKDTVSKLSTKHVNDIEGKHKQWRSFAEGCSSKILDRAKELEQEYDDKIHQRTVADLDISNREITDEDEEEIEDVDDIDEIDEELEEQINNQTFSLELYDKYKETKFEKIKEYIQNIEAENEKCSSKTAKIEVDSFEMGQHAGETIPLTISKKLESKAKRR